METETRNAKGYDQLCKFTYNFSFFLLFFIRRNRIRFKMPMEEKLIKAQTELSLTSSVSSMSLQDSENSPVPTRKAYVPPHLRNIASKPTTSLKPSEPFKSQRNNIVDKKRNDKDPKDPFYNRPDVGARTLRLESTLFGSQTNSGINFDKYDDIPVDISGNNIPEPIIDFKSSNVDELLKFNIEVNSKNKYWICN